jgi:hypothetical protein
MGSGANMLSHYVGRSDRESIFKGTCEPTIYYSSFDVIGFLTPGTIIEVRVIRSDPFLVVPDKHVF